jgi:hypothetical protein
MIGALAAVDAGAQPYPAPYPGAYPAPWANSAPFGPYVGAAVGPAHHGSDYDGSGNSVSVLDRNGTAWKAFVGFRFNPWWGVELGYVSLPSTRVQTTDLSGTHVNRYGYDAFPLSVVGFLPVAPNVELTGRLGLIVNGYSDRTCTDRRGRDYYCSSAPWTSGVGVRFGLPHGVGLRLDYDYYAFDNGADVPRARVSAFFFGADLRF